MKKSKAAHRFCLQCILLLSLWSTAAADGAVETVLHRFASGIGVYQPFLGRDGRLYGRTGSG